MPVSSNHTGGHSWDSSLAPRSFSILVGMLSQSFRVSKNLPVLSVPWHLLLDLCLLGLYMPWSRRDGLDKDEEGCGVHTAHESQRRGSISIFWEDFQAASGVCSRVEDREGTLTSPKATVPLSPAQHRLLRACLVTSPCEC